MAKPKWITIVLGFLKTTLWEWFFLSKPGVVVLGLLGTISAFVLKTVEGFSWTTFYFVALAGIVVWLLVGNLVLRGRRQIQGRNQVAVSSAPTEEPLLDRAKQQIENLSRAVTCYDFRADGQHLTEARPFLDISFIVHNASIYDLILDGHAEGRVSWFEAKHTFDAPELIEPGRGDTKIRSYDRISVKLRQFLPPDVAQGISNQLEPFTFSLNDVDVFVWPENRPERKIRLDLTSATFHPTEVKHQQPNPALATPSPVVLRQITGQTYENMAVHLDGMHYINCTFRSVTIVWNGGPFEVTNPSVDGLITIASKVPMLKKLMEVMQLFGRFTEGTKHETKIQFGSFEQPWQI